MYDISIIIPHYNTPELLDSLLFSIGSHDNVEIVVIDDNSDDEIYKFNNVVSKYRNICSFFKNNTNIKGAGVCRNVGLDHISGKWVLFADSDDLFFYNWYDSVEPYLGSDFDVVYFSPTSISDGMIGNRHLPYKKMVENFVERKSESDLKIRLQFITPWSKMIKRKLIIDNNIRFSQTLFSNDVLFLTKVGLSAKHIHACLKTIYCVTERQGTLTKNSSFEALYIRQQVFCETYKYIKCNVEKNKFKKIYVNNVPIVTIINLIIKKYKLSDIHKILHLYKDNNIPLITMNSFRFDAVVKYLKTILRIIKSKRKI